jgi:hypothetical protein
MTDDKFKPLVWIRLQVIILVFYIIVILVSNDSTR